MTAAPERLSPAGFEVTATWERLPEALAHRDVSAVGTDSGDRVYLLTRYDGRVLVYERDGTFVGEWGSGVFTQPHGLTVSPDDHIWCVDNGDHTVRKFTRDGRLLLTLGTPGVPSDTGHAFGRPVAVHNVETVRRPAGPFNGCTNVAVAEDGDVFVADGYGNCRVHHFTAEGEFVRSWGTVGTGPGQFHLPHCIRLTGDGMLLVGDRENDRIQIFDRDGTWAGQWTDVRRPSDIAIDRDGTVYVAEMWRPPGKASFVRAATDRDQPGRVTVLDRRGRVLDRWGTGGPSDRPPARGTVGTFVAPHGIAVDSHGDVYVAEVTYSFAIRAGLVGADLAAHQLQKFVKTDAVRAAARPSP
ncbi:peptidyl-alpha-hydroxyglycine alpha-amidating lyase family protein [Microbispora sp. CA-102843]|uniref:peptidyl-alpha-hydroxyglycine alpha-amidating lyase family protein n=1 Tax=Microbispora sp. CA-102843 TaxID=3239952 RepID=UPI003D93ED82